MAAKTHIKKRKGRYFFIVLFVVYLGVCTYFLFATGDALPAFRKSGFFTWMASVLGVQPDKILHALLFIPIVPLAWAAVRPRFIVTKILILWSGFLFGVITEIVQFYLPYRTGDITDVTADIVGSVLGIPFLILYYWKDKNTSL
ncbi:MAG: VanZ family protein [Bacteroidales bacterium]|nr:VanZ family protein [Bacteroidales bacterium]MDD2824284.1 VanZ family protein [Bacteroidales bacterium]MDD3100482.1 VanZ family protein [Bacteroidales bacterium]MDD3638897.1 VanZ family protein [Bacteroidales bacterium]MDD3943769.1 VanZ family protein [Bacteroidales bacterium]